MIGVPRWLTLRSSRISGSSGTSSSRDHGCQRRGDRVDDRAVLGTLLRTEARGAPLRLCGRRRASPAAGGRAREGVEAIVRPSRRIRSSGVAPMKPSIAKAAHEGCSARRRPRRSAWRSGRFAWTVTSLREDDLVEAPAGDLGERGVDPVQEVLVRPCRRQPELVGGGSTRPSTASRARERARRAASAAARSSSWATRACDAHHHGRWRARSPAVTTVSSGTTSSPSARRSKQGRRSRAGPGAPPPVDRRLRWRRARSERREWRALPRRRSEAGGVASGRPAARALLPSRGRGP